MFTAAVRDWIRQNPPYEKEYSKDSWNSFTVSVWTVVWMQQYAWRKGMLDSNFREELLASI